jgi:hypothetical protein
MSARIALCLVVSGIAACQREPAIVIRFEPADLAGKDLAKPHDLAPRDLSSRDAAVAEAKKETAKTACKVDADCVLFTDDCCDCANGGKQHAIAKNDVAAHRAKREASCKDVMCSMMVANDPTCAKRPACVAGACAMRDARPDEIKRRVGPPPR